MDSRKLAILFGLGIVTCCIIVTLKYWPKHDWPILEHRPNAIDLLGDYHIIYTPTKFQNVTSSKIVLYGPNENEQRFSAEEIPRWFEMVPRGSPIEIMHQIQGRWKVMQDPLGGWLIYVDCEMIDGFPNKLSFSMSIRKKGDSIVLLGTIGDPDNDDFVVFQR